MLQGFDCWQFILSPLYFHFLYQVISDSLLLSLISFPQNGQELLGLLSIGVAMLSLFVNNLVDVTSITVAMIYLVFLVALTTLAIYHTLLVFRYFRLFLFVFAYHSLDLL